MGEIEERRRARHIARLILVVVLILLFLLGGCNKPSVVKTVAYERIVFLRGNKFATAPVSSVWVYKEDTILHYSMDFKETYIIDKSRVSDTHSKFFCHIPTNTRIKIPVLIELGTGYTLVHKPVLINREIIYKKYMMFTKEVKPWQAVRLR